MQRYEKKLNLPNFFEEIFNKKTNGVTFPNVTPFNLTKNLTIQIMENKERYHNAKRALYPTPQRSNQLGNDTTDSCLTYDNQKAEYT